MKSLRFSTLALCCALAACQSLTTPAYDPEARLRAADGREYRVERLDKKPGAYARIGNNMIRYFPHATLELDHEDEAYLYVRQYTPVPVKAIPDPYGEAVTALQLAASSELGWQPFDAGLPRRGQWRDGFAVADVNGDGKLDIVFGPARKSFAGPVVYLGDGAGKWTRWNEARFAPFAWDYGAAAVADFDGDGKADIAFGVHLRGLVALRGDGAGQFTLLGRNLPVAQGAQAPVFSSRRLTAVDWDGDGRAVIVALNEGLTPRLNDNITESVVAYRLRGDTWERVANEPPMSRVTQIATTSSGKRALLLHPPGADGVLPLSERSGGKWRSIRIAGVPANAQMTALAIADTAAGSPSLFAIAWRQRDRAGWWNRVALLREGRDGRWQLQALKASADTNDIRAMTFARSAAGLPLNLVTVSESGQIDVFRQAAGGEFTRDQGIATPDWRAGCQGYDLQARDIDGDGGDEIIVAFAGEGTALTRATECTAGGAIQAFKLIAQKP